MSRRGVLVWMLLAAFLVRAPAQAFDLEPPDVYQVRDFFDPPHYRAATVSPGGRFAASFVVEGEHAYISVFDGETLDSTSEIVAAVSAEPRAEFVAFIDDDTVFLEIDLLRDPSDESTARHRIHHVVDLAADPDDGAPDVKVHRIGLEGEMVAVVPGGSEEVLMMASADRGCVHRIAPRDFVLSDSEAVRFDRVDRSVLPPGLGDETRVAELRGHPFAWLADAEGTVRLGMTVNDYEVEIWYRASAEAKWRRITTLDSPDDVESLPVGLTPDGRRVVVLTNEGRDTLALYEFDPRKKTRGRLLFEHPSSDVRWPIYDGGSGVVIGATVMEAGLARSYYFARAQESVEYLRERFDDQTVAVLSKSRSGRQVLVFVQGPSNPGSFHLLDLDRKRLTRFGQWMPWIDPDRMAPVEAFRVRAENGPEVDAFISLPPDVHGPPPLVVFPHGGPIGVADGRSFDPVVQLLAMRGYAVLKVNYRGSGGYGQAFLEQGLGEWGLGIEDDIDAAIEEALKRGLARSDRICVVGASYGGYSALMMVARWPDRFVCAGSIAGVTDIPLMFSTADWSQSRAMRDVMNEWVGDPDEGYEALRRRSPSFNVEKLKVPILLVHGTHDRRVDIEHSARLMKMLDLLGAEYEWLPLQNEPHGLSTEASIRLLARLELFLADHLGPVIPGD